MAEPKTVLVVDDEKSLCEILSEELQDAGYNVLTAHGGHSAIDIVKARQIDAVVTDIRMPEGDGVQLLDAIKAHNVSTPVVLFLTGFADISVEDAYDKGAEAVFSKPVDEEALLATLTKALTPLTGKWTDRPERYDLATKVDIEIEGFDQAVAGKILNIGRGGMFVHLTEDLPRIGTGLKFIIRFKDIRYGTISGIGTVRWVRPATDPELARGTGVEFEYFEGSGRRAIVDLINDIKTSAFIPKA